MSRDWIQRAAEVVLVLALAGSGIFQVHAASAGALQGGPPVHDVLVAAITLPLLARRTHPTAVFCCIVAATWIQFELGGDLGQPFIAVLVGLYSLGAHARVPATFVGPAAVLGTILLVDVPRLRDGALWDDVVPAWFVLVGTWAFGRWMGHRRRESHLLAERAETAERDAEVQTREAVAAERSRIARELHDLVAHSLGVMVIQSQGAQRTLATDSKRTQEALENIEVAGRDGLSEMRRLLELLTDPDAPPDAAPQPSLDALPDLVGRVRSAGLDVELTVDGERRDLPAGVELTAYRVVQEGLTNALKHAAGAPVQVRLVYGRDSLEVDVLDDGPDDAAAVTLDPDGHHGRGLVGMRERLALYGGTLSAGPRPGGGYVVSALIPAGRATA